MKKIVFLLCFFLCSCMLFSCQTVSSQKTETEVDILELKSKLQGHSLVVYKDGEFSYQDERGLKPLLIQIEKKGLKGAMVADKKIGKAAALLMVYGKVKEAYTNTIAEDAIKVFEKYKIKYSYNEKVEYILNNSKDGLCPMEQKVKNISSPKKAYEVFSMQKQ